MVRTSKRVGEGASSSTPPPKKSKAGSSSSSSSVRRAIHSERNVDMMEPPIPSPALDALREYIGSQYLTELATKNDRYNELLVREFYDSFPKGITSTTPEVSFRVRGKTISLSPDIIESFLQLPEIPDHTAKRYFEDIHHITWDTLVETIYAHPSSSDRTKGIQCGNFKDIYRVFWLFVRHNILPTSQHSEVPKSSCKLLVNMVSEERPIPFGTLIYRSILGSALGNNRSKLVFPCLITRLCALAKVSSLARDTWKVAHGTLNAMNVGKSGTQRDVATRDHDPSPLPPPPSSSSSQGGSSSHTIPPTSSSTPFDPSLCDPNMLALFHHFDNQNMERFNQVNAQIAATRTMISKMAHMRFGGANDPTGSGGSNGGNNGNDDRGGSSSSSSFSSSCVICLDGPVEGAFIPCGHMAGCMPCLNEIKAKNWDCPVCRGKVDQVLRLYSV